MQIHTILCLFHVLSEDNCCCPSTLPSIYSAFSGSSDFTYNSTLFSCHTSTFYFQVLDKHNIITISEYCAIACYLCGLLLLSSKKWSSEAWAKLILLHLNTSYWEDQATGAPFFESVEKTPRHYLYRAVFAPHTIVETTPMVAIHHVTGFCIWLKWSSTY